MRRKWKERGSPPPEEPQDKLGGTRREGIGQRGWGVFSGSRGREKKAEAAMGEQTRGEVRQQAGLGRAGIRMGRESEKLEQPQW